MTKCKIVNQCLNTICSHWLFANKNMVTIKPNKEINNVKIFIFDYPTISGHYAQVRNL